MESEAFVRTKSVSTRKSRRAVKLVLSAAAALLALFLIFNLLIAAPAEKLACTKISSSASTLLNDSVREVMNDYASTGDADFARVEQTGDGGSVLKLDSVGMNLLASRVVERAQQKIEALSKDGVSLPLGSVLGIAVFSGVGPSVSIGISPLGEISSRFSSKFEDAGVNQTRFSALLTMHAEVELLIFGKTKRVSATLCAPVCETIIVGSVPGAYTNVESMEDALNLIPAEAKD